MEVAVTGSMDTLWNHTIAYFQKEWHTRARMGARLIMGSFGGIIVCIKIFSPTQVSVYCSCMSENILACAIGHFRIYHNTLFCPSKILHNHCFPFLLGLKAN